MLTDPKTKSSLKLVPSPGPLMPKPWWASTLAGSKSSTDLRFRPPSTSLSSQTDLLPSSAGLSLIQLI